MKGKNIKTINTNVTILYVLMRKIHLSFPELTMIFGCCKPGCSDTSVHYLSSVFIPLQ